jgi:hyperosmotically inducible periplasmic protein
MKNAMQTCRTAARRLAILGLSTLGLSTALSFAAASQGDDRFQQRVTREVGHELRMLPQFGIFDNLAYKVEGDTVTLMGQVRNAVLKDEAAAAVKHIEGVEHVNNQIEILPVSINDDRIRHSVARAIFRDARLSRYSIQPVPPIHIIVKGGHVALEGVVRDQGDKDTAGIRANGVPGVFAVQNNLQVEVAAKK